MSRGGQNLIDLVGQKFDRWTVIERAGRSDKGRTLWLCRCTCGTERKVDGMNLKQGGSKSCGCLRSEPFAMTHGFSRGEKRTRVYRAWRQMKARCDNPNMENYKYYGGKGITYDPRWAKFEAFLEDMGEPDANRSLDRIESDKNYCKENCRWSDSITQRRNRGDPLHWVDIFGEKLCFTDAVRKYGKVSYVAAMVRVARGWSDVDAITTPSGERPARSAPCP